MKLSIIILFVSGILIIASCSKNETTAVDKSSDAQLIEAIKSASNKQLISFSELPSPTRSLIAKEYTEDFVNAAKIAPELGYEINLRCEKGPFVGEHSQAYFDLNGRQLKHEKDQPGKERKLCFNFILPVTFTMPDGSEITIEQKVDWNLIKTWYENHPDSKEKPALQFPVEIRFKSGKVKTLNDENGLRRAIKFCNDQQGDKRIDCFRFFYPITYTMSDGSEVEIKNKESHQRLRKWYAEHPDVDKPTLNFPVKIKFKDGTIKTIHNHEEMVRLRKFCQDNNNKEKCFRLVLPVTYIMLDGTEITIEQKEDRKQIKDWYEQHPDVNEKPALVFPVEIAYFDKDETTTINNREELKKAREDCQ